MKKLDINITKAQLKSYTVELKEGKPTINATIELLTAGGMSVTTYTVYTDSWSDKNKFELPLAAISPIVELAKVLEDAVVAKCRDSQMALGDGVDADPIEAEDLAILTLPSKVQEDIIDIDDKPIDLSEIPF